LLTTVANGPQLGGIGFINDYGVAIKGNGSATKIHAAIELEGKTIYTSSTVKVIDGPETIK
jgi:hypothetical protein